MDPSSIYLPLHHGKAPFWLLSRMKRLSKIIVSIIIEEYGENEFIKRISNPIFFQSLSNVLGFDWNSSGTTTVLTGVLKSVVNDSDFGIKIAGGKGREGLNSIQQLKVLGQKIGLGDEEIEILSRNSKLAARVDNNALQDGYDLYHHAILFSKRSFTIIQQGMNPEEKMARRYHLRPERFKEIEIEEPHSGIVAQRLEGEVCNLISKKSKECRKTILDIVRAPLSLKRDLELISLKKIQRKQTTLEGKILCYQLPKRLSWDAIEKAYNLQPENFESLLLINGLGKNTLRALALVADLVYNTEYDKQDPAKYSFAVGGKDGVPFPVNRKIYDETIEFLESLVEQTTLDSFEKSRIFERLGEMKSRVSGYP
jgi:hypothetical protein